MKTTIHRYLLLTLIFPLAVSHGWCQDTTGKTRANDCNMPQSQFVMDVNNVKATLLSAGDIWFDKNTSTDGYEVPKNNTANPGPKALFAGALWISGLDVGRNERIAAETYRSNGVDYYSGPLDNTGSTDYLICNMWDRHFPVWSSQIQSVIAAYAAQGYTGQLPLSAISDSILYWPGRGNPHLTALGYDMTSVLAPFYDFNGDGIYDPQDGDYPTLRQAGTALSGCGAQAYQSGPGVFADQMVFWVMNDANPTHSGSGTTVPIRVQVNALSFAFQSNDEINDMTFYHYDFINKSGMTLTETYISQFTDVNLGCPNNDAIGCDTTRNLAFVYNGTPQGSSPTPGYNYVCDQGSYCNSGTTGYGCQLPMLGIQMLESPSDTDIDPQTGLTHELGMTAFSNFGGVQAPPGAVLPYRYLQKSYTDAVTPISHNGQPVHYMYPSDPSDPTGLSECTENSYAGDRRMVQTSGPFTFLPCATQPLTLCVSYVSPVNFNCPSLGKIDSAADKAQAFFNSGFRMSGHEGPLTIHEASANTIRLVPNPVTSLLRFACNGGGTIDDAVVYDLSGRVMLSQSGNVKSVDMSSLSDGLYLVRVRAGDSEVISKVVKK